MSLKPELPPKPNVTQLLKPPLPPKSSKPELPPKPDKIVKHNRHSISLFKSKAKSKLTSGKHAENVPKQTFVPEDSQIQTVKVTSLIETDLFTKQRQVVVPIQMAVPVFDNEFTEEAIPIVDTAPSEEVVLIHQRISAYEATMICDVVHSEEVVNTTDMAPMESATFTRHIISIQDDSIQCLLVPIQITPERLTASKLNIQIEHVQMTEVVEEVTSALNSEPPKEYYVTIQATESENTLHKQYSHSAEVLQSITAVNMLRLNGSEK